MAAPGEGDGRELVVLTQNVWGGAAQWERRCELLARMIDRVRPDVVGLQEVHAPDACGERSQAHDLAARLGGRYTPYYAPARVSPSGACEGVALLCEHHVHERSVEALSLDETDVFEGKNQRIVLCAMLEVPCSGAGPAAGDAGPPPPASMRVDVFVTHLSLSSRARARTIVELGAFVRCERARSGSAGAVLLGDFNAVPKEPAMTMLERSPDGAWIDAWKRAHGDGARGGTWPAFPPLRRLDYVFFQPISAWEVLSCERVPFSGSDHLGVLARLRLC